jgi:hypothetical protein
VFYFIKLRRTEADRNGARDSHQKLPKSAIEPDFRAAFGHFIGKTRSLRMGREDWKRKGIGALGGRGPRGRSITSPPFCWVDRLTFSYLDLQFTDRTIAVVRFPDRTPADHLVADFNRLGPATGDFRLPISRSTSSGFPTRMPLMIQAQTSRTPPSRGSSHLGTVRPALRRKLCGFPLSRATGLRFMGFSDLRKREGRERRIVCPSRRAPERRIPGLAHPEKRREEVRALAQITGCARTDRRARW